MLELLERGKTGLIYTPCLGGIETTILGWARSTLVYTRHPIPVFLVVDNDSVSSSPESLAGLRNSDGCPPLPRSMHHKNQATHIFAGFVR